MASDLDTAALPPGGLTWGEYIARWVEDVGGWTHLAHELIARARGVVELADDPQTVERGLRRLAQRGHKPGGQYGRWMLRSFGLSASVETWLKWMGQYHTRFSDLPCGLRLEQLAAWNRPPVSESPLAAWLQIGIAGAYRSKMDFATCERWLRRAERTAAKAGPAAEIEVGLLRGFLATEAGDRVAARRDYDQIAQLLDGAQLVAHDEVPLRARLHDQRAYHYTNPEPGQSVDILAAQQLYADIAEHPDVPFASFRKSVGLAYCAWKLGQLDLARQLAERASRHAGDGGLVRMRVMALNMLSRVMPADSAEGINRRARQMALLLEDEELSLRVDRCSPKRPAGSRID